ncbi:MAG: 50S ribosomal protein L38e [Candidatus Helarchaeales archaeon]
MPKEITDVEKFIELSKEASECRVKRVKNKDVVKLKLRTKRYLYVLKTTPEKAKDITGQISCEIYDV